MAPHSAASPITAVPPMHAGAVSSSAHPPTHAHAPAPRPGCRKQRVPSAGAQPGRPPPPGPFLRSLVHQQCTELICTRLRLPTLAERPLPACSSPSCSRPAPDFEPHIYGQGPPLDLIKTTDCTVCIIDDRVPPPLGLIILTCMPTPRESETHKLNAPAADPYLNMHRLCFTLCFTLPRMNAAAHSRLRRTPPQCTAHTPTKRQQLLHPAVTARRLHAPTCCKPPDPRLCSCKSQASGRWRGYIRSTYEARPRPRPRRRQRWGGGTKQMVLRAGAARAWLQPPSGKAAAGHSETADVTMQTH